MRRITLWFLSTVSALVLLFSYHTSTDPDASQAAEGPGTEPAGDGQNPPPAQPTMPGSSASPSGAQPTGPHGPGHAGDPKGATTVLGPVVPMKYGPIQVQVVLAGGRVVGVHAVTWPTANHKDIAINSAAIPRLDAEATAAGSAAIDLVSGATYTSHAYVSSLQAALDQAHR